MSALTVRRRKVLRGHRSQGSSRRRRRDESIDLGQYRLHLREIATLLVRLLKLLGFDSDAIAREFAAAAVQRNPRTQRLVTANLGYWARVLARWAEDPRFTTEEGMPRDLPLRGSGETFAKLVAGELPGEDAERCLQILTSTRSIVRLSNGLLRWRSRVAINRRAVNSLEALRPLRALLLNLQTSPSRRSRRHIEPLTRGVSGFAVTESDAADLRVFVESQGMMLLEAVDNWLRQRAIKSAKSQPQARGRLLHPYVGLIMTGDGDLPASAAVGSQLRRPE